MMWRLALPALYTAATSTLVSSTIRVTSSIATPSRPSILPDPYLKMSDGREAVTVGALNPHQVVARLLEAMHRPGIAVLRQGHDVAVTLDGHFRAAVAEVPGLLPVGRA